MMAEYLAHHLAANFDLAWLAVKILSGLERHETLAACPPASLQAGLFAEN